MNKEIKRILKGLLDVKYCQDDFEEQPNVEYYRITLKKHLIGNNDGKILEEFMGEKK